MTNATSELKIVYRHIDELIAYSANARQHTGHQINLIAKSIDVFGFTNPVLIDHNSRIIAGHGRVVT